MTTAPPAEGQTEGSTTTRRPRRALSLPQKIVFALFACVLILGLTEGALRLVGVEGAPDRTTTWFADHILRPPLWSVREVRDPPTRMMVSGQQHHFHPFPVDAAEDTFRIAVFGGSAAHGYGVVEPGAFPHRLEQLLQRAVPETEVQVINLGTIAWSSQQILWANRRIYELEGWDLIVVYAGHNELLELSSWKSFKPPGEHRRYTRALLLNQRLEALRVYQVLRWLIGKREPPALREASTAAASPEEALELDLVPGLDPVALTPAMGLDDLEVIPREKRARIGELERSYAARTYRHNIGKVIDLARSHSVPVVLLNPAPNDFHDPAWFPRDGEDGARFNELMQTAEQLDLMDKEGREQAARDALEIFDDPRAMHVLAGALMAQYEYEEAMHWFTEGRRWAEYPNRVVPEVSEAILGFEGEDGVLGVLDIEARFRSESETGSVDYRLVYDHCHPSVEGNWVIAGALSELLLAADLPGLKGREDYDLQAEVSEGRRAAVEQRAPNPRLWEWTGRSFEGGQSQYIADYQGQWRTLVEEREAALGQPEVTAMDWLWAGNARFYDYRPVAALAAFEQALEMDPSLCLSLANSAYALRLIGSREQALAQAEAAVTCDPDAEDFRFERDLLLRLSR